jgi:hypothetical protein
LLNGKTLNEVVDAPDPEKTLRQCLLTVWQWRTAKPEFNDIFTTLANIPFKGYVSTNPDTLIEEALNRRGVGGAVIWPLGRNTERGAAPQGVPSTPDRPLVSYLYGSIQDRNSLVLTEDDYYQQLVTAAQNESPMPKLNQMFTSSSLIFLGFRLHEWDFRVLFRRIKLIKAWPKHHELFNHVAVQIDSTSTRGTASEQTVKRFLKHFFNSPRIEVFRGSAGAFVKELEGRCRTAGVPLREARVKQEVRGHV